MTRVKFPYKIRRNKVENKKPGSPQQVARVFLTGWRFGWVCAGSEAVVQTYHGISERNDKSIPGKFFESFYAYSSKSLSRHARILPSRISRKPVPIIISDAKKQKPITRQIHDDTRFPR